MLDSENAVHLVFAVDRNFLPFTAVAAYSAILRTQRPVCVHVLQGDDLGDARDQFSEMVASLGGSADFYQVDRSKLSDLPVTDHVSLATYYRLSIAELLPQAVSRVIYLDGDLIVRSCLSELYRWPTEATGVAAVPEKNVECQERLGLPADSNYLNAGVLVLDLEAWRRNSVASRLYEIARSSRDKLRYWDQDILALFLQGKFVSLPAHWNVNHPYFFGESPWPMPQHRPSIVHFSGAGLKPWSKRVSHPYGDEFWELAAAVRPFGFHIRRPQRFKQWTRKWLGLRKQVRSAA